MLPVKKRRILDGIEQIEGKKKVVPRWWRPDDYENSYSQNYQGILMEQLAS